MKERNIMRTVHYAADEVPAVGRTDWAKLRSLTDEEIEAAADADEDSPLLTDDELAAGVVVTPSERRSKVPISIRMDEAALERFKEKGPRYQTRLNDLMVADSEGRVLILDESVALAYEHIPSRAAVMNAILRQRTPAADSSGWNVRPTGIRVSTTNKRGVVGNFVRVPGKPTSGHAS